MSLYTFIDKSIYFPDAEVCILSDIHFSAENSHRKSSTVTRRIQTLIDSVSITTLILNGDTFSEFPFPQDGIEALHTLDELVDTLILLPGNHEDAVGGFGKLATDFQTQEEYSFVTNGKQIVVTHGHEHPSSTGDLYIIGHLHPATSGTDCAVRIQNSYQQTDVLALPAFTDTDTTPIEYITDASPLLSTTLGVQDPYTIESRF